MVVALPTVELTKDVIATVDKRLGEVRFVQYFEDGERQIIFVPIFPNMQLLCREVKKLEEVV